MIVHHQWIVNNIKSKIKFNNTLFNFVGKYIYIEKPENNNNNNNNNNNSIDENGNNIELSWVPMVVVGVEGTQCILIKFDKDSGYGMKIEDFEKLLNEKKVYFFKNKTGFY